MIKRGKNGSDREKLFVVHLDNMRIGVCIGVCAYAQGCKLPIGAVLLDYVLFLFLSARDCGLLPEPYSLAMSCCRKVLNKLGSIMNRKHTHPRMSQIRGWESKHLFSLKSITGAPALQWLIACA